MEYSDYKLAQRFIEEKSLQLMKHEKKPLAKTGFPIQNYTAYHIQGRDFYTVASNVFLAIIQNELVEAIATYPNDFGTNNATDVINAIYKVHPLLTIDWFTEFLKNDQFCYVMENVDGVINDRILRIDLFRQLDQIKNSNAYEFTGGIFHALKHFSYNGINLSTGNDKHDIASPAYVIEQATTAFFFQELRQVAKYTFESVMELDEKYNLHFYFYYEKLPKSTL